MYLLFSHRIALLREPRLKHAQAAAGSLACSSLPLTLPHLAVHILPAFPRLSERLALCPCRTWNFSALVAPFSLLRLGGREGLDGE